jgi:hypothetical protein
VGVSELGELQVSLEMYRIVFFRGTPRFFLTLFLANKRCEESRYDDKGLGISDLGDISSDQAFGFDSSPKGRVCNPGPKCVCRNDGWRVRVEPIQYPFGRSNCI